MRPRHDARLVPAAIAAYACAALVTGQVFDAAVVRNLMALGLVGLAALLGAIVAARVLTAAAPAKVAGGAGGSRRFAGSVIAACRRPEVAHVLLVAAVVVMTMWTSTAHMSHRWDGGFDQAVGGDASAVDLRGTVRREPVALAASGFDDTARSLVELSVHAWRPSSDATSVGHAPAWHESWATVLVVGGEELASAQYGEYLEVQTSLDVVSGERAVGIGWDSTVLDRRESAGSAAVVASMRRGFASATSGLPDDVRGLTTGMVIGDTRDIPGPQREQMKVTGLTHLTAVSGAHFAIVAVVLHSLVRRIRAPRLLRAVVAALGMSCFAALVIPDPSVARALVMALVGAAAVAWGRPPQALAALCAAVITLVVVDPFVTLEAGFALSVSAVAAIVLWAPRLRALLGVVMPPMAAMLISVPLAAQAVCAPILILLEPRVSLYAVVANLLAAPAAAPVTLIGLGAVVAGTVAPAVAVGCAWLASVAVWPVAWTARFFATLPGTTVMWPPGIRGALLLAMLTAVAMWWTSTRGGWRLKTIASAVGIACVIVTAHTDKTWQWASPVPADWAVVACDVGQGDMMLLRGLDDSAVVIDAGPGDGTSASCLARYGVTRVSLLILTHPHLDHDGGVAELMEAVQVDQAWLPRIGVEPGNDRAAAILATAGVPVTVPDVGETWNSEGVMVAVRGAREAATGGEATGGSATSGKVLDGTVLNDASLVVWATTRGVSVLGLGDLEDDAQQDLEDTMPARLDVDVVKVPHHGSSTQDAALVERLHPLIAVVSVGADNTYGHPSKRALDLYGRTGAVVRRTDECADIVLWRDPVLRVASECR